MIIDVDLSQVPPAVSLLEPDDFRAFKVVARGGDAFVSRDTLLALAGDRAQDAEWLRRLDEMIAYAQSKGWTDERGAVQAHIEHAE